MKKKIMVIMCSLLLAVPVLSFAEGKKKNHRNVSAYKHAHENAKFNRSGDVFNNKVNKEIRTKRAERLTEKDAAEAKRKTEEAKDKDEGQFKVKF